MRFCIIKLVVGSELVPYTTGYDPYPDGVPDSLNLILADVPTQKYPPTTQNQDDEDERWNIDNADDVDDGRYVGNRIRYRC
jgi:hypothetical protein